MIKYKQSTIAIACGYITMKYFNLDGVELIVDNGNFGIKQKEINSFSLEELNNRLDKLEKNIGQINEELDKSK